MSKDGVLFSKDMNKLYVYPQEKKGNYTLPDETTLMDMFAFTEARGLTDLRFLKIVTGFIWIYRDVRCLKILR